MERAEVIKKIMEENAILTPLSFGKCREKAYGAMYSASMVLGYHDMELHFDMWHHHSSEERMTRDEVLEHIDLKGLRLDGKYYDLYWHARWYGGKCFLHPDGWFRHEAKELEHALNKLGMEYGEHVEEELLALGFKRIPELDSLK